MNFKALTHFLALAEHLHFGQASVAGNVSISGLSRNIKQLESEVGAVLFDRDNRTVRLTTAGERFRPYARDAVQQWQQIRHELAEHATQLQGEISLYCSVTASHSILFPLLSRFRRDFSGIEIKLHTGDPELAIGRITAGREDLAVAALPDRMPRGVVGKPMVTSPLLFIAPLDPGELTLPVGSTSDAWADVPLILSEGGLARSRVDAWFRERRIKPGIYAQVAGNEAIVSMVSLGFGVGVVPEIVLDNSALAGSIQVLDVRPELEPYQVGLCTLKKNLGNPLVRAVWESGD